MAIFHTDTGSLGILEVSASAERVLTVRGSGSAILIVSGSTGPLLELSDIKAGNNVFTITSGSIDILNIEPSTRVIISGSLVVTSGITGSLSGSASGGSGAGFPFSGSAVITGSLIVTQSFVDFSMASSITGSFFTGSAFTGSFRGDGSALTGIGGGDTFFVQSTGISIADPTSAEDITLAFTSGSTVIRSVRGVLRGSANPSVTVTLRYDADRNATGTAIVSAQTVTSTTSSVNLTLTGNTTVPANNFIWLETTALAGTVNELFIGLIY